VGRQGFEPWTNGLKIQCSTKLSYPPVLSVNDKEFIVSVWTEIIVIVIHWNSPKEKDG
jgi:hypothetical protein